MNPDEKKQEDKTELEAELSPEELAERAKIWVRPPEEWYGGEGLGVATLRNIADMHNRQFK